jgi:hypothetical protein
VRREAGSEVRKESLGEQAKNFTSRRHRVIHPIHCVQKQERWWCPPCPATSLPACVMLYREKEHKPFDDVPMQRQWWNAELRFGALLGKTQYPPVRRTALRGQDAPDETGCE